jgi:hypothetical protein
VTSLLYAGVGAVETPPRVLARMTKMARELREAGFVLRSGGARGADTAFEEGAGDRSEIFRAEDCTPEAFKLASMFHPVWDRLSERVRLLHGRNAMIVLGRDLKTPVVKVLCWTSGGSVVGGTGMTIKIALTHNIPVTNLFDDDGQMEMRL